VNGHIADVTVRLPAAGLLGGLSPARPAAKLGAPTALSDNSCCAIFTDAAEDQLNLKSKQIM
jgi:hypothetical protein